MTLLAFVLIEPRSPIPRTERFVGGDLWVGGLLLCCSSGLWASGLAVESSVFCAERACDRGVEIDGLGLGVGLGKSGQVMNKLLLCGK